MSQPPFAGLDDQLPAGPLNDNMSPSAIGYDMTSKSFDPTVLVHPVDSALQLALSVLLGSYSPATTVGQDIGKRSERYSKSKRSTLAEAEVRRTLKFLTDRNDILIQEIETDVNAANRILVAVTYDNLRTGKRVTWARQ